MLLDNGVDVNATNYLENMVLDAAMWLRSTESAAVLFLEARGREMGSIHAQEA